MLKVELPDLDMLLGVVIEMQTGVQFVNQTHGSLCAQSSAEGIFYPLETMPRDAVWQPDSLRELSRLTKEQVETFLIENCFEDDFRLDEERLRSAGEAWVPVVVKDLPSRTSLKQFAGKRGWITYTSGLQAG